MGGTLDPGLTTPERAASQRELDQLRAEMRRLDDHGTRGVGVVQAQLTEVIKDMAELKISVDTRFGEHNRQHEREAAERRSDRRWALGFAVAVLGAIGGLYPYLHSIVH